MNANDSLVALLESAAEAPRDTDVDPDGWVYDVATGEVLGRVDVAERFQVDSVESADWALELRSRIEAEIVAIDARLKAVTERLQAMRSDQVRRLSWWEWRFGPSLAAFARSLLGKKSRTVKFGWGQVAFRTSAGSNEILSQEEAVAWMRVWAPERVRVVESVTIKDVLKVRDAVAAKNDEEPEHLPWLASSGPQESVKISTGIEVEGVKS